MLGSLRNSLLSESRIVAYSICLSHAALMWGLIWECASRREQTREHMTVRNQVIGDIACRFFPTLPTTWSGMLGQTLIRCRLQVSLHILLICSVIGGCSGKGFYGISHRLQGSETYVLRGFQPSMPLCCVQQEQTLV